MGSVVSADPTPQYRTMSRSDGEVLAAEEDARGIRCSRNAAGALSRSVPEDTPMAVVQFSCASVFCGEEEGSAVLEIVRLGDTSQAASVEYHTEDSSAKAGKRYEAVSGRMDFEQGEDSKNLTINILQDDLWDTTLEFKVKLRNPQGAHLGTYLRHCRVLVIDDDSFPTNRFKQEFESTPKHKDLTVPPISLMYEYFKFNLENDRLRWITIKFMILDQVKNLYFFLTIYLQMYLVDVVLAPKQEDERGKNEGESAEGEQHEHVSERRLLLQGIHLVARRLAEAEVEEVEESGIMFEELVVKGSRKYTAVVVGLLYIIPFFLLHWFDIKKIRYGIAGIARKNLQANLLRKFLNYKEETRASLSMGDITMSMVRDCKESVDCGFMKVFQVVRVVGKLSLALVFILAENKMAVIPLLVFPIIMAVFLKCREHRTIERNETMAEEENSVVLRVNDAVQNYRLLADFDLTTFMVDSYENNIDRFNEAEIDAWVANTNNKYLPPWLMTLLIGGYFILSTKEVKTCGGPLSLGAFLATIVVFKEIGLELSEIYGEIMEIQKATGPLMKVCHYMNKETNLRARMLVNREYRKMGQQLSGKKRDEHKYAFPVDAVDLEIENLQFSFPGQKSSDFQPFEYKFQQGKLYAFVGPPHGGKATLLKLLGNVFHLNREDDNHSGYIFTPSHIRTLHVSQETFLLHADLLTNLIFNAEEQTYGTIERVKQICRDLHFSPCLRSLVEDLRIERDLEDTTWMSHLTHTDMSRLNLARALIMNPELMVLHKPSLVFNEEEKDQILTVIRRHVDERGLHLPVGKFHQLRRPRTVFFTSASNLGMQVADAVIKVSSEGLSKISAKQIKEAMRRNTVDFT